MFTRMTRKLGTKRRSSGKDSSQLPPEQKLSSSLQANIARIRQEFDQARDLVVREFTIGAEQEFHACLVYLDGLVDKDMVNTHIMKSLMLDVRLTPPDQVIGKSAALRLIEQSALSISHTKKTENYGQVIDSILNGDAVVFIDGTNTALIAETRGWEGRTVTEPITEVVVRGPREGFTETLSVNISLLRRKIRTPRLKLESLTLGQQTKTPVCLAYIKGIANDQIIAEVRRRMERIDIDAILESGYIEQLIEDAPASIFPTVGNTEKPDVAAAKLLEGRVAILVDGTPFALTVPYLLIEAFQVAEDYYSRPFFATVVRWLRFTAFFIAISLPAWYVALATFHQEMIPTLLMIPMAAAKEATPFPAVVEALMMGVIYEIVREAGIRLPRPVGQAISIVGALVIGEAAVSAGLIGAPMVIIISLTAIASFVVTALTDVVAIVRLLLVLLAGVLGNFGIIWGLAALLLHLASLRSFGVPYLSPLAPTTASDLKDVLVKAPLWMMLTRPRVLVRRNRQRQEPNLRPEPPSDEAKEINHR